MENSSCNLSGNSEDFVKNKSLLLNIDYDSGYQESNLDSCMENSEVSKSEHIYLSEDALLETPELCKYPDMSPAIEKHNFEGNQNDFKSPAFSICTTHVSGSVDSSSSQELSYTGFHSDQSDASVEIPLCNPIVLDNENTKSDSSSQRDSFKYIQNKGIAFNNITNTLATNDQMKKLTLIVSKTEKENVYSVARKYRSLTPTSEKNIKCTEGNSESKTEQKLSESKEESCVRCVNCCEIITDEESYFEDSLIESCADQEKNKSISVLCNAENLSVITTNSTQELNYVDVCSAAVVENRDFKESKSSPSSENATQKSEEYREVDVCIIKSVVSETLHDMLSSISENIESKAEVTSNTFNPIVNIISTPEKIYEECKETGLSPDLFTEDQLEDEISEIIPQPAVIPEETNALKKDYLLLRRVQNNLKGVIPPRSMTLIKMSVGEMLNKIESNKRYFWSSSTENGCFNEQNSKSLLVTTSVQCCRNNEFSANLKERCLGMYHNRSKFSEEFEELCIKYGQRFVGAETQSSCTIFETNTISPTKRRNVKPQWNTKSPGKRLSHLARRRITFSSANLQSGSSFLAGSRARQILVDAKKIDLLNRRRKSPRKSPRKTPKKTPGKSPRIKKRTPSSSAKKKLAIRFRKVTGEIEKSSGSNLNESVTLSAKRTLFHSPDEVKKLNRLLPSTSGTSLIDQEFKRSSSKRALFISPSKRSPLKNMGFKRSPVKRLDFGIERKRKRTDEDGVQEITKFARSHSDILPSVESDVRSLAVSSKSESSFLQTRPTRELTTNNKKKLQLAIYEALRSQNILPTHAQFKTFASNLGRLTKQLFLMAPLDVVGTTEKMLRIARHHVIAIVKGRSPEEIYEEIVKQKSRNLKPQGYVAPEESSSSGRDNKIERVRKSINFGDDNNG